MISPQEFYRLLSQKFEKGDPRKEIDDVFKRFDTKKDNVLDVEELHAVANMLGESLTKADIRDMIKTFHVMIDEASGKKKEKAPSTDVKSVTTESESALNLSMDNWYF